MAYNFDTPTIISSACTQDVVNKIALTCNSQSLLTPVGMSILSFKNSYMSLLACHFLKIFSFVDFFMQHVLHRITFPLEAGPSNFAPRVSHMHHRPFIFFFFVFFFFFLFFFFFFFFFFLLFFFVFFFFFYLPWFSSSFSFPPSFFRYEMYAHFLWRVNASSSYSFLLLVFPFVFLFLFHLFHFSLTWFFSS